MFRRVARCRLVFPCQPVTPRWQALQAKACLASPRRLCCADATIAGQTELTSRKRARARGLLEGVGQGRVTVELRGDDDAVAVITIHNPARANALSGRMMVQFAAAVEQLELAAGTKVVLLQGTPLSLRR